MAIACDFHLDSPYNSQGKLNCSLGKSSGMHSFQHGCTENKGEKRFYGALHDFFKVIKDN